MFEKLLAQAPPSPVKLGGNPIGGDPGTGLGPFSRMITGLDGLNVVISVVSSIIGVMTLAAGLWFMFNFLSGGLQWVSAGGDKHSLESAQQRILNALIGLIIVVAGWTILALVSKFTGTDFLLTDPGNIIKNLSPK